MEVVKWCDPKDVIVYPSRNSEGFPRRECSSVLLDLLSSLEQCQAVERLSNMHRYRCQGATVRGNWTPRCHEVGSRCVASHPAF